MTKFKLTCNNDILSLLAKNAALNEKVALDSGKGRQQLMLDRSDEYVWSANDKVEIYLEQRHFDTFSENCCIKRKGSVRLK